MAKSSTKETIDLNPDVSASARWHVHREVEPTIAVNADRLDITDSGALIFTVGDSDAMPSLVVPAHAYTYCSKVA